MSRTPIPTFILKTYQMLEVCSKFLKYFRILQYKLLFHGLRKEQLLLSIINPSLQNKSCRTTSSTLTTLALLGI